MPDERQEAFEEAKIVGLVLGVDFKENISTKNLLKKVNAKKEEIEAGLKSSNKEVDPEDKQEIIEPIIGIDLSEPNADTQINVVIDGNNSNTIEELPNNTVDVNLDVNPLAIEKTNSENEDDYVLNEMPIVRVSKCGNYRTKIIGAKETARRSNLTVEEVVICLESGEAAPNGWNFLEV